jgi:hypothetical protein
VPIPADLEPWTGPFADAGLETDNKRVVEIQKKIKPKKNLKLQIRIFYSLIPGHLKCNDTLQRFVYMTKKSNKNYNILKI